MICLLARKGPLRCRSALAAVPAPLHLTAKTSDHACYSTAHKRRRISGGGQTEEPPMDLQFHRRSCGGEFPSPTRAPSAFSSKGSALRVRSRSAASSGLSTASPSSQVCWCPARTPVPCRSCLRLDQLIQQPQRTPPRRVKGSPIYSDRFIPCRRSLTGLNLSVGTV